MYKVFFSYSTGDNWAARSICKEIQENGVDVFRDKLSIESGEEWENVILENLKDCDEFWVLITPSVQLVKLNREVAGFKVGSIERPYVWLETGAAWYKGVTIVPILFGIDSDIFDSMDIPLVLKKRKAIDLDREESHRQLFDSLKERARRLI